MHKLILPIFLISLIPVANAQPFTSTYTFANVTTTTGLTDPTPPPTASGLTFGSFSAVGTPSNPNANGRFSFISWPTGATNNDDNYASLTGVINTGEYYQVTLTPSPGYEIDISGITFTVQRSGFGIRTYVVRSSLDNYVSNMPASINPANANLSVQPGDIFFWNFDAQTGAENGSTITPGPNFMNLQSPVTFRIYATNSESGTGTFSIDNFTFVGNASPIIINADFTFTQVCEGMATPFTDQSVSYNGPIILWAWDFGDPPSGPNNTSALQNPTHTFTSSGSFNVRLIVTNANGQEDTIIQQVDVLPLPVPGFTYVVNGNTVTFTNTSTGNGPMLFSFDPGDFSGVVPNLPPSHTYPGPGTYTACLTVTDAAGCMDSTCRVIVILPPSGLAGLFRSEMISVFPSPASNYLSTTGINVDQVIEILDVYGKRVWYGFIEKNSSVNVSKLPEGIYMLRTLSGKIAKFVISR